MGGEDIEEIIKKLQEEEGNEGSAEEGTANAHASEHKAVKEAMEEGLLQPHGIPPNSKQEGIFRILCKNPNGLNNQITGNLKMGKAIYIKDKLDADGLLFCKHRLNLHHRDNKNNFKQMFQRKVACRAIAANNIHQNIGGGSRRRDRDGIVWRFNRIYYADRKRSIRFGTMVLDAIWRKQRA
jgi:hypothetical protein